MKHEQIQKTPSYFRIFLSRYFYLDFIYYLQNNIWLKLVIFSSFLVVGYLTKDYSYPLFSMSIYSVVIVLLRAYIFQQKVKKLILEDIEDSKEEIHAP